MLKNLYQNKIHYLVLLLGLAMGLLFFFHFPYFKSETIVGLCFFYFVWGIIHHWRGKDLHIKIVLEYFLVALIACFILLSLIWRSHEIS